MTNRRAFILGLTSALAAPAVVRAESLMHIAVLRSSVSDRQYVFELFQELERVRAAAYRDWVAMRPFVGLAA